jgi:type I restriction enzyme S subunit
MKSNYKRLGAYIEPVNQLNDGMEVNELLGISNQKFFQNSHTNTIGIDLSTYRIVRTGQFAYNRATTRNGDKISIALRQGEDCIVSPSYRIFKSKDENVLNSEYLMMWFRRPEFDRYARFKSHGSAHEFFEWEEMCNVTLPIPHIDKQRKIVKEYNTIQSRINLNQQMIQKLEETAQAIYKQWFVEGIDLENLPQGWRVGSFEELIKIGSGKSVIRKSEFKNEHYKYPIYGAGGIMGYSDDILLNEKIISIGRVGTHGIVQRINFPCWLSDNTLIIKSPSYEYVYQILLNINYDEINRGGVQGLITQTDINNLQILLPEKSMLEKFEEISSTIFKFQDDLKIENQKLSELKELLLSKLATVEG